MHPILLIDFGSTYTKVTAVDVDAPALLGTASAYTTVETDINQGLANALRELEITTGPLEYEARLACSSAAGGLRMVACGLVPSLTEKAARMACLGAGAKVVKSYSYGLTDEDIAEIDEIRPDILLLAGGTDGGNSKNLLHNAGMLAGCESEFPILLAGNRMAAADCERLLAGREVYRCANVMPALETLNVGPIQEKIRELFLQRIIQAKGLSEAQELINGILMPTPAAMLAAMQLLADGCTAEQCRAGTRLAEGIRANAEALRGLGELLAVDLGGATTDVYSIATGAPGQNNTVMKGLPEPYAKRSVEGDIGMRYSIHGILEAAGLHTVAGLASLTPERVEALVDHLAQNTGALPETPELAALDEALAAAAVATATTRHAGTLEEVYTPMGLAFAQTGKDLTRVTSLVLTGGAIIHNPHAAQIARHALYNEGLPTSLRPKKARVYIDRHYILAAMGLLSQSWPAAALAIMKKELEEHGA